MIKRFGRRLSSVITTFEWKRALKKVKVLVITNYKWQLMTKSREKAESGAN